MVVLGLSGGLGHDPSACLMEDGRLIAAAEEERFTRKRHEIRGVPKRAAAWCLNQTSKKPDVIALGWDPSMGDGMSASTFVELCLPTQMWNIPCIPVGHHDAHAASAFWGSGFDRATVVVMDGEGGKESTSIYIGQDNKIKKLYAFDISQSLGHMYTAATWYLGWEFLEEGKLMGLAPYGSPHNSDGSSLGIQLTPNGYTIDLKENSMMEAINAWVQRFVDVYGEPFREQPVSKALGNINNRAADFAAQIQTELERAVLHLIDVAVEKTGISQVVLAGGVALNCTANGKISSRYPTYIFPAAGDAGTAFGAACVVTATHGPVYPVRCADFGPAYEAGEIERVLRDYQEWQINKPVHLNVEAARILATDEPMVWFEGGMEFGPRALGRRSIVARPDNIEIRDFINREVKHREWWRPFGPTVLEPFAAGMFDSPVDPFMLKTSVVDKKWASKFQGVIHVDGTTRPQIINYEDSALKTTIESLFEATGIPGVINTSLNGLGQPICMSPGDAVRFFANSPLKYMVMGPYLVQKNSAS